MKRIGQVLATTGISLLVIGGGVAAGATELPESTDYWVKPIDVPASLSVAAPPGDTTCFAFGINNQEHGRSCYEYDGDDQWVLDTYDNDRQARVHVWTEYGKDRYCADDTSGWTQCDYNHKEHECVRFHGYYPPHSANNHFPATPWISTSTGKGCTTD